MNLLGQPDGRTVYLVILPQQMVLGALQLRFRQRTRRHRQTTGGD